MNIARMYTIALGSFGYTEDEARFLYLVAAHSGYFTCQQFLRFIDGKPGKRSLSFVRKLVEQGHASARPYLRNGKVYHVFARNLYEAIGKDNVRFRRKHSTEYIRTRLAALDFILGRLDWKFLESESEKVRLFTEQLGIDKKYLPAKRYAGAVRERQKRERAIAQEALPRGAGVRPLCRHGCDDRCLTIVRNLRGHAYRLSDCRLGAIRTDHEPRCKRAAAGLDVDAIRTDVQRFKVRRLDASASVAERIQQGCLKHSALDDVAKVRFAYIRRIKYQRPGRIRGNALVPHAHPLVRAQTSTARGGANHVQAAHQRPGSRGIENPFAGA